MRATGIAAVLVLLAVCAPVVMSQAECGATWVGGDGDWSDPAGWDGGSLPSGVDFVCIDGAVTVHLSGEVDVAGLDVGADSALALEGPTLLSLGEGALTNAGFVEVFAEPDQVAIFGGVDNAGIMVVHGGLEVGGRLINREGALFSAAAPASGMVLLYFETGLTNQGGLSFGLESPGRVLLFGDVDNAGVAVVGADLEVSGRLLNRAGGGLVVAPVASSMLVLYAEAGLRNEGEMGFGLPEAPGEVVLAGDLENAGLLEIRLDLAVIGGVENGPAGTMTVLAERGDLTIATDDQPIVNAGTLRVAGLAGTTVFFDTELRNSGTLDLQVSTEVWRRFDALPGSRVHFAWGTQLRALSAALDGTLSVAEEFGTLEVDQPVRLLEGEAIAGGFATLELPDRGPGFRWEVDVQPTAVDLVARGADLEAGSGAVRLEPGWNLVAWLGPAGGPASFAPIADAVEAVFAYDTASGTFLAWRPEGPAALNSLESVDYGTGLWVLAREQRDWMQPRIDSPARAVGLEPGFNLVSWTGPAGGVADALGDAAAAVDGVYGWDAAAQDWSVYLPGLPAALSDLSALSFGDAVWVLASAPTVWAQPTGELSLPLP